MSTKVIHLLILIPVFVLSISFSFTEKSMAVVPAGASRDLSFSSGDGTGTAFNNNIWTCDLQGEKLVVAGYFTGYNGTLLNRIARLDVNGNLDTTFNIGTGFNDTVFTTRVFGNKIYAGGNFTEYNGNALFSIARLNLDGSLDTSFNTGTGFNSTVRSVYQQSDSKVLVGGNFTEYNGQPFTRIVRLNSNGSVDETFNIGTGFNNIVYDVAQQDSGKYIVSGNFTQYNGTNITRIARLNIDGTLDNTFNPGTGGSNYINKLYIQSDGKILIIGNFTLFNGTARSRVARLTEDGALDNTFVVGTGLNTVAQDFLVFDNMVLLVGSFTSYNGQSVNKAVVLNDDGTINNAYDLGLYLPLTESFSCGKIDNLDNIYLTATTRAIKFDNLGGNINSYNLQQQVYQGANKSVSLVKRMNNGNILVGGNFTKYNNVPYSKIVVLDQYGEIVESFNPGAGMDASPRAMSEYPDGRMILSGWFTQYDGQSRNYITRINSDGLIDETFNPGTGANNGIWEHILLNDGKILIGGNFTQYNGVSRNRVARLNSDGSLDTSFNPGTGANSWVNGLHVVNDDKYVLFGQFTTYNGTAVKRIVRINNDGTIDNTFTTPGFDNGSVESSAVDGEGNFIVGGTFTAFGGVTMRNIAKLGIDGSLDESFDIGEGFQSVGISSTSIWEVTVQNDGKIVAGGIFDLYNNTPKKGIIRLLDNGQYDSSFSIGIGLNSRALAIEEISDNNLLVGGEFTNYNTFGTNYILKVFGYELYQADNVDESLDVVADGNSIKTGTLFGSRENNETLLIETSSGSPIVEFNANMSVYDIDMSAVTAGTSVDSRKSFVSNLKQEIIPEKINTHKLFIPRNNNDKGVFICPEAHNIQEISLDCIGGVYHEYGKSDQLSLVSVDNQSYWLVSHLTGTGGMSLTNPMSLSDTGQNLYLAIFTVVLTVISSLYMILFVNKNEIASKIQGNNKEIHI